MERYVVPINDISTSVVRESIIDKTLSSMSAYSEYDQNGRRYVANNEMIAYFDKEFTKEDVWYQLGGKSHPEYISYFYIGLIEPILICLKKMWIFFNY